MESASLSKILSNITSDDAKKILLKMDSNVAEELIVKLSNNVIINRGDILKPSDSIKVCIMKAMFENYEVNKLNNLMNKIEKIDSNVAKEVRDEFERMRSTNEYYRMTYNSNSEFNREECLQRECDRLRDVISDYASKNNRLKKEFENINNAREKELATWARIR
jgi:hypothetical protein